MKRINKSGQEAIEFALISGLVFIAALGTVLLFGNKLATFFSGGAVSATANQAGSLISSNNGTGQFTPNYSTEIQSATATESNPETINIDGVDVTYNTDGSAYFNMGDQDFNIPSDAMGFMDQLVKTAEAVGAAGFKDTIMQAYIQLIKEYQEEHPGENVPSEWAFGDSLMSTSGNISSNNANSVLSEVYGDAQINLINLKVGDKTVIFVTNHSTYVPGEGGSPGEVEQLDTPSVYMIEGGYRNDLSADEKDNTYLGSYFNEGFYGTVTSLSGDNANQQVGIFSNAGYNPNQDGINIGSGDYKGEGDIDEGTFNDWMLDFSDANKEFNI